MGIKISQKGDFSKALAYFKKSSDYLKQMKNLTRFGEEGVRALKAATPVDTGETAKYWYYEIQNRNDEVYIEFKNANVVDGVPIAIILQYGHGTGTGGYVQGRDYINPAIRPIFDRMAEEAWKEVTKT